MTNLLRSAFRLEKFEYVGMPNVYKNVDGEMRRYGHYWIVENGRYVGTNLRYWHCIVLGFSICFVWRLGDLRRQ